MIEIFAIAVFVCAYALIALEHSIKISKSAVALLCGAFLWMLVAVSTTGEAFASEISHTGADIFSIVAFLLAAMSLVEILVHYKFFDVLRGKLFALGLNEHKQFLLMSLLTFFLSAVLDNLTTTIVMIQISRRFFKGENLLIMTASIVISANAGGAFSPIGDVTTIMLWFAKKFGALEVILKGFLPAFVLWIVSTIMLMNKIKKGTPDSQEEVITKLSKSEKLVVTIVFLSFLLPIMMSQFGLPPYMGLLFGLGLVWFAVDTLKRYSSRQTHLSASIDELVKKADIASIKFFIGILLAVSALHSLGVLEMLAHTVYGSVPSDAKIIIGNVGLGLLSAILDNVPLTAIAINLLDVSNSSLWVLLALTVGTGGSLLVVGSAAGVVASGMVKELSFGKYFKIAFVPALSGFFAGVLVWLAQYYMF
jgi:Na+/H+ antiporter NhaD/arsenite permease-like protein